MAQVTGGVSPQPTSIADAFAYLALQELATRIAHHNTGKALPDAEGYTVMKRVAADENLHYLFYRDLVTAALEIDPSGMVEAIKRQVLHFEMPGHRHPRFRRPRQGHRPGRDLRPGRPPRLDPEAGRPRQLGPGRSPGSHPVGRGGPDPTGPVHHPSRPSGFEGARPADRGAGHHRSLRSGSVVALIGRLDDQAQNLAGAQGRLAG